MITTDHHAFNNAATLSHGHAHSLAVVSVLNCVRNMDILTLGDKTAEELESSLIVTFHSTLRDAHTDRDTLSE